MKKILSKRYYKIKFTLASALSLSSGYNDTTDKDLLLDERQNPYIPASSLAGIYRSFLDEEEAIKYFGIIVIDDDKLSNKKEEKIIESEIIVYDANLAKDSKKHVISVRYGIKVDEYKTAIDGKKYDYEILEPGCTFVTYVEQNKYVDSENVFDKIASSILTDNFAIGAKTSRGLGKIKDAQIKVIEFDLNGEGLDKWLDFDVYNDADWKDAEDIISNEIETDYVDISVNIKQVSALSIREYRTDVIDGDFMPDQQQMVYTSFDSYSPVIPGTSWNGLIRHALINYGCQKIDELFGDSNHKSKIIISETILKKAKTKVVSRNSIDRFSGGTVDKALFTEKACYDGEGILEIKLPKKREEFKDEYRGICCAIADLNEGILALGGETSIGHGLFKVEKITVNGEELKLENYDSISIYKSLITMVLSEGCKNV